jgi:hypothetical protein
MNHHQPHTIVLSSPLLPAPPTTTRIRHRCESLLRGVPNDRNVKEAITKCPESGQTRATSSCMSARVRRWPGTSPAVSTGKPKSCRPCRRKTKPRRTQQGSRARTCRREGSVLLWLGRLCHFVDISFHTRGRLPVLFIRGEVDRYTTRPSQNGALEGIIRKTHCRVQRRRRVGGLRIRLPRTRKFSGWLSGQRGHPDR